MLRFLKIARLAVIDAVEVEFEPGFNVLTGETGAGKSILVEAVGLLLGGRASGDLVRTGEESALVEAIFQDGDRELVVRREVTAQGRSRAFVDGALVTAGALRDLAGHLIELHGQHEHQTLLDPSTHVAVLDAFGGLTPLAEDTRAAFDAWRAIEAERQAARTAAGERATRLEFLAFQLEELEKASLRPGEDEELAITRQVLANAHRIERLCSESYAALYESDGAALATLAGVWKRVGELAALDPAFAPYLAARDGVKAQLQELADFLRRYAGQLDVSPGVLQQTEDRLAVLERLKRKHGPTLTDVIARREALRDDLRQLESIDERLADLDRLAADGRARYLELARTLSAKRRALAAPFAAALVDLLSGLALERTRFEAAFNAVPLPESEWTGQGIDRVEFFMSPNPGEDLRPLARIVSGGELSRVMLALKTMTFGARLAAGDRDGRAPGIGAPGMIFDEVDTGIGGRVADVVGRRLRDLGSEFQVLCITHLPQVAAHADAHFVIEKQVDRDRTRTRVARLSDDRRVDELARMLAGDTISEAARASAREMLRGRGKAKGELKSKGESERRRSMGEGKERRGA